MIVRFSGIAVRGKAGALDVLMKTDATKSSARGTVRQPVDPMLDKMWKSVEPGNIVTGNGVLSLDRPGEVEITNIRSVVSGSPLVC